MIGSSALLENEQLFHMIDYNVICISEPRKISESYETIFSKTWSLQFLKQDLVLWYRRIFTSILLQNMSDEGSEQTIYSGQPVSHNSFEVSSATTKQFFFVPVQVSW